jgi:hypothetical protein
MVTGDDWNQMSTSEKLALRSKRSGFWDYPLAFIVGMVWALLPAFIGLLLFKQPVTFAGLTTVSFLLTLMAVTVIEAFYWRSVHRNRRLALEALNSARLWAAVGGAIKTKEVALQLAKGIQNQNVLHLKQSGSEMLEMFNRLDADLVQPWDVPDLRIKELAMEPWTPAILPFMITFSALSA